MDSYSPQLIYRQYGRVLIALFIALVTAFIFIAFPSKVKALSSPSGYTPVAGQDIPQPGYDHLTDCEQGRLNKSPAYYSWVGQHSSEGYPAVTTITVGPGETSIFLQWYISAAVCQTTNTSNASNWQVVDFELNRAGNKVDAVFSGIQNDTVPMQFGSYYNKVGTYFAGKDDGGFEVAPNAGFQSGQYLVKFWVKGINQFGQKYQCIGGSEAYVGGLSDFGPCEAGLSGFYINIQVETKAEVSISGDCNILNYSGITSSSGPYDVVLWVDGAATIKKQTNKSSGSSGTFDISSWKDGSPHEFSVRIEDLNTGQKVFSNTVKNDGCLTGKCSPSNQTVSVGLTVSFSAIGGAPYSWSAPGGSPSTGTGSTFSTIYNTVGTKTVTVSTASGSSTCQVTVNDSGGCDSLPDPWVPVHLYNTAPNNLGQPTSASRYPSQDWYQVNRTGIEMRGTSDISNPSGGFTVNAVPSDYRYDLVYKDFNQPSLSSDATVKIDYSIFIQRCPYDYNQGQVSYRSNYDQQHWRSASSPSYYQCDYYQPASRSGTTCTYSYPATPYCYGLYSWNGSTCIKYHHKTSTGLCKYYGTGALCAVYTQPPSYYCGYPGGYRSGTTCHYTYSATPYYNYSVIESWKPKYRDNTANGIKMEPCWVRNYQVTGVAFLGTPSLNDREDPTKCFLRCSTG